MHVCVVRLEMRSLGYFKTMENIYQTQKNTSPFLEMGIQATHYFKTCMCGEVGIRRPGFLWLGDFLSNSKNLVDLQNMNRITCKEPYFSKLLRSSDTVQWVP